MSINKGFVGFAILAVFCTFGIWQSQKAVHEAKQANQAVAQTQQKEIADNAARLQDICKSVNTSYTATRALADSTTKVVIGNAVGLQARFLQSQRLNPPATPQQQASADAGAAFFEQLVKDTKQRAAAAKTKLYAQTVPQQC